MLNTTSLTTLDKRIARTEREIGAVDARVARAQATIDSSGAVRAELQEQLDYLAKVRERKLASLPVAAADEETVVLNTEAEVAPAVSESLPAGDVDPRMTAAV